MPALRFDPYILSNDWWINKLSCYSVTIVVSLEDLGIYTHIVFLILIGRVIP